MNVETMSNGEIKHEISKLEESIKLHELEISNWEKRRDPAEVGLAVAKHREVIAAHEREIDEIRRRRDVAPEKLKMLRARVRSRQKKLTILRKAGTIKKLLRKLELQRELESKETSDDQVHKA